MEHVAEILKRRKTVRGISERGELIRFFSEKIERPAKTVGIRLAHYKTTDLYALKSAFTDRLQRDGREAARKYWWWTTKTSKV